MGVGVSVGVWVGCGWGVSMHVVRMHVRKKCG